MKKVLYGVFMAFFAVMTMGAIQSCTDDLTDFKGQYNYDYTALKTQVEGIDTKLGSLDSYVRGEILNRIAALEADNATNKADIAQLKGLCATLGVDVADLKTGLSKAQEDLAAMKVVVDASEAYINQLKEADIINKVAGLDASVKDLEPKVTKLYNEVFGEDGLVKDVADLDKKVGDLQTEFEKVKAEVDALLNRVNNLITNILVQATDSPVFGNFSLPIGVQGNMLFNWYFVNRSQAFKFPTASAGQAYNATEVEGVTFKNTIDIAEGYAPTNIGNLYLTINPVGHVLEGKTFSLETSKGSAGRLPFALNVVPSDDEIFFGLRSTTRVDANEDNGFYKAEVVVPGNAQAFESTDVKINDDLKNSVKEILKDRTKRTALNLVKAVWDQVNGTFPRYAVRADWKAKDAEGKEVPYSVLSNYDLGVATAQPLSFAFYADGGSITDRRIPTFNHQFANLWNRVKNSGILDIKKEFKIGDFTLSGVSIKIAEGTSLLGELELTVTGNIENKPITDGKATLKGDALANVNADMVTALNDALKQAIEGTDVNKGLTKEIEAAVNSYVTSILESIQGKINSTISNAEAKTQPWFERLDKLVDIYNKAADKINAFLAHPNDYLQPCVFYKADGQLGLVSAEANNPTVFVNGGGEGFDLFPSTYTAELVAPCYKKYISCVSDPSVDTTSEYLGTVLDGSTYKIFIPTKGLKSGNTYKFVYQALDYYGKTSTRFFYIQVK